MASSGIRVHNLGGGVPAEGVADFRGRIVSLNSLPVTGSVPVFDCHVLLTKPASPGDRWQARCARAPHIIADGATERETLMAIVSRFKFFVHEHHVRKQPIPWTDPPATPTQGEVERFIPVHL